MTDKKLDKFVKQTIHNNYAVFLAFELADKNITFEEYIKKLKDRKK